jgi:hypothetical protein
MQILTESRYRELLQGFSKPVMSVKTLSVRYAANEAESIFKVCPTT